MSLREVRQPECLLAVGKRPGRARDGRVFVMTLQTAHERWQARNGRGSREHPFRTAGQSAAIN